MKFSKLLAALLTVLPALSAMGQGSAEDFVYILPSKEIAETGEDLFFKAYLMDRQTMALSERSQTLYLEIRSERDSLVWSEKYPLIGGRELAAGGIFPRRLYQIFLYLRHHGGTPPSPHPRGGPREPDGSHLGAGRAAGFPAPGHREAPL